MILETTGCMIYVSGHVREGLGYCFETNPAPVETD